MKNKWLIKSTGKWDVAGIYDTYSMQVAYVLMGARYCESNNY